MLYCNDVFKTVNALFLYKREKSIFTIMCEPKKLIFEILSDVVMQGV